MCLLGQDSAERAPLVIIPISYLLPQLLVNLQTESLLHRVSLFLVCLLVDAFTRLIV